MGSLLARRLTAAFATGLLALLASCTSSTNGKIISHLSVQTNHPVQSALKISDNTDATERYKTHSPFAAPSESAAQQEQQAGQIGDDEDVNPLLEEQPHIQMHQEDQQAAPEHSVSSQPSRSSMLNKLFSYSDTKKWTGPANEVPGNASSVPGASEAVPEDRTRDFGTYGRGIPIAPSGPVDKE